MSNLNIEREELYKIYRDISSRVYDPYSSRFSEMNPAYISGTTKINIEDMIDALAEAMVFDRDSEIPVIKEQPHTRLTLEPMLLGGKKPLSALDGIEKQVGQVTIVNGVVVDDSVMLMQKKLTSLKTGITNSYAKMCGEVLLTSALTHPKLDVDYDPTNVSVKGNLDITTADNETISGRIIDVLQDFFTNKGYRARVLIDRKVADQLMAEINAQGSGKRTKGDYKMVTNGDSGYNIELDNMNVPLELISPIIPLGSTTKINTDNMIMLYAPETLCEGYAVIETYDGAAKQPLLVKGQLAINYGKLNEDTGRSSIHAKSAPLPVVVRNDLIERWTMNII